MDHTNHQRLEASEMTAMTLVGAHIYDLNEDSIGKISHVHGMAPDLQIVADVGTFLGMFGKSVVIPVSALDFMRDTDGTVHATTAWTKDQIEALPVHANH